MNKSYVEIAKGVKLLCLNSNKFKTNCIKVDFYLPIGDHLAAQNVLTSLMGHTSKKYNTKSKIATMGEELYGARVSSSFNIIGDTTEFIFTLEFLNPKIIVNRITSDPDKETLLEPVWLIEKCQLLNDIDKEMKKRNTYQGINL